MQTVAPLFAMLAIAVPLAAQTTAAAAPAPHIVIDTVGPDGWRARLGPPTSATCSTPRRAARCGSLA